MRISRFITAALTGSCLIGSLTATPQFVSGPSARYAHSMAYDSAREVVVLFGGSKEGTWPGDLFNETWEWDGTSWTKRSPASSPTARKHGAMAYDSARGVCVYFGGASDRTSPFAETWEWDGTAWTLRSLPASPPGRWSHNMVYDSGRQIVVLFGGLSNDNHTTGHLGNTWEYDGLTWTNVSTSGPAARDQHSMAYQVDSGKTLLFGGHTSARNDETWEWDGSTWTQRFPSTKPSGRDTQGMCYDRIRNRVVLFGGFGGTSKFYLDDTWLWDGNNWAQATPPISPAGRNWVLNGIAYDAARRESILFGGWTGSTLGDTWTFDGTEWRPKLDYQVSPINGNRYALTPSTMKWPDAEALAVLEGGHLATVRNQAEQDWIFNTLVKPLNNSYGAWIGLNDEAVEGKWVWSSGESVTYTNWAQNEPGGGLTEPFVHIFGVNYNCCTSKWNDHKRPKEIEGIIELPGIRATSSRVGTGCIATGTPPSLFVTPPVQGRECLLIANSLLPNTAGVILLGIQHKGIPLSPKCTAYFDITLPSVPIFFSTDATGGWLSPPIAVSTSLSLTGVELALQAAFDNLPTAPFGMALSNGVWVTIGY